jgi:hypothetical protein
VVGHYRLEVIVAYILFGIGQVEYLYAVTGVV